MVAKAPAKRTLITNDGYDPDEAYPVPELQGEFTPAPDLERIGRALIKRHLHFPDELQIDYLWKIKGGTPKGKKQLGKVQELSGLTGYYGQADFAVWLGADHVDNDEHPQSRFQVEASLFHYLKYIVAEAGEDGELHVSMRAVDAEVFRDEVEHYGFWKTDLVGMARTVVQRALPGMDGREVEDVPEVRRPKEDVSALQYADEPDDLPALEVE